MVEAYSIVRGDITIQGKLYTLNKQQKRPALIISHEFGLSMLSTARYARRLYAAGYNVFIFDFPGSGSGKSTGRRSEEMSVLTEVDDLASVVAYARRQPYVDASRIILAGASQGGLVTALYAAAHAEEIERIVLYYPALCIPDDARRGCILGVKIDPHCVPDRFRVMGYIRLGRRYVRDAAALSPWAEIRGFAKPVLICHGTRDRIVPLDYARKAVRVYPSARLVEMPGAGHCFALPSTVRRAVRETLRFLRADA